jgi:hypothetical protein
VSESTEPDGVSIGDRLIWAIGSSPIERSKICQSTIHRTICDRARYRRMDRSLAGGADRRIEAREAEAEQGDGEPTARRGPLRPAPFDRRDNATRTKVRQRLT